MQALAIAIRDGTGDDVRAICATGINPNGLYPLRFKQRYLMDNPPLERTLLIHTADRAQIDVGIKTRALLEAGADPLAQGPDRHSAIALAIANLAAEARDYAGMYDAIINAFRKIQQPPGPVPSTRSEYVEWIAPRLRVTVEGLASRIPVSLISAYSGQWRNERVDCIFWLAVYTAWANVQKRMTQQA